ncbi:uncharacterized protein [Linepithema humile]|uniref:uncharacterized protein isoform X2 n=1 Tax=Linepithema humile TaxID=83485 RepID=UPI000623AC60|nr:PREDICTED: uncharacterized protein LOC105674227 isoform X1 [Linepithema humile]XP_012225835.1 PREDICTED: uncharacterized protein LOC105674227 isoform X1 [Linepithema humile]
MQIKKIHISYFELLYNIFKARQNQRKALGSVSLEVLLVMTLDMTDISNTLKNNVKNCKCELKNTTKVQTNREENLEEYEYVKTLKNIFDENLFPHDFDMWTVSKQYNWINENISKFFPNVPESLLEYIPAFFHQGDCNRSLVDIPEWLDMDKYRKGQKFVQDYFAATIIATLLSLFYAYSFENTLRPIILNGQSHTPYLGYKRYISTIRRIINWYKGKPWVEGTPAYKDMQITREMHMMVRNKLSRLSDDEINAACTFANPWCPDRELLLNNFTAACPFEKIKQRPYKLFAKSPYKQKYFNDVDMAVFQCCFVGLVLLYPNKFGVHNATDEDLEAFCHIWRCYGYFLGMEDKYNFCRGNLVEIKQRTRDFYQYWALPNCKDTKPEYEHMTRCVVELFNSFFPFIRMPYKTAMLLFIDAFDISMSHLYASFTRLEWITYNCWKFIFRHVLKLSSVRSLFNRVMYKVLDQAINYSPQKHAQLHKKSRKQVQDFSIKS